MKIYVPGDAAARALGADAVAAAVASQAGLRGLDIEIVRNGSRGMIWLEPLVEVDTEAGRIGFGPLEPADVPALFDAPETHPKALGPVEEIPFFKAQTRLTFARVGRIDPLSLADYEAEGGLAGLRRALEMSAEARLDEVLASGLRGRGGAGFPAGIKWKTVAGAKAPQKVVVCNADEGDSGTFADRMLMEGDPFALIEGMAIAGLSVGATQGFVYIRSEYPDAIAVMRAACDAARGAGLLGPALLGNGPAFDIEIRVGAGAYVCGEETSLLNSLEGKRGTVRAKPPLPALQGFMGRPTVVNNVLTLATVPWVFAHGAEAYAAFGVGRSRGTMPFQLAGNIRHGGLFETAFGTTLGDLVEGIGGGTASGRPVKAVQIGGPLGAYFTPADFGMKLGYEECAERDGIVGHAGLVVFDETADMGALARFAMEFCAHESCGMCTPCRIGSTRGVEVIDAMRAGDPEAETLLRDLCEVMTHGSLCALGGFAPYPVLSALNAFPEEFRPPRKEAAE